MIIPSLLKQVTLEGGDVLLVPKHWWHFVRNIDPSISVNMWIAKVLPLSVTLILLKRLSFRIAQWYGCCPFIEVGPT